MATKNQPKPETIRLSVYQAERLVNVFSQGPLIRRVVDEELLKRGWLELYDGDETAVDAADGSRDLFYDPSGCIREHLMPEEWLAGRRARQAWRTI